MDDEAKRERRREYNRRYNERHPKRRAQSSTAYNHSEIGKERLKVWVENNPARYAAAKLQWARNNQDKTKKRTEEYRKANPGWMAAQCAKRRARKLNATPPWVDEEGLWMIEEAYSLAALRTKMTGKEWVVDHKIPLQGRKVCGLHVIENLQVITAIENSRKHNKFICG